MLRKKIKSTKLLQRLKVKLNYVAVSQFLTNDMLTPHTFDIFCEVELVICEKSTAKKSN